MPTIELTQTAKHWSDHHFSNEFLRGEWSFHPEAKASLHRVLKAPSREEWFHRNYLAPRTGLRALGIGVGRAATELNILSLGAIDQYDLYDVSQAALDDAKASAEQRGLGDKVKCVCADARLADLPENSYDVITFIASLHHVDRLEETLAACRRALVPGGVLWAAEYIGPNYFDYPAEHTVLARQLFHAIDPALKKSWEPVLRFPTVEEVIAVDPTEAVRSADIPGVMKSVFDDLTVIPTYGTFAFIMFWCLNHDALYETADGEALVRSIMEVDRALIDSGTLPHYFAYFIARKPTWRQALGRRLGVDPYGPFYRRWSERRPLRSALKGAGLNLSALRRPRKAPRLYGTPQLFLNRGRRL